MAWHSAWAEATSSSQGVIHLSSDGSWASTTVYVRDGSFSGTLLGYEYGYNEFYDGTTHYINVYMNGLQAGRTYYLYVSYQTSGGATDLYDVSPTTLNMPYPKPFRGQLEDPYNGYTTSGSTINVEGWALDESGINYLAVYIDGYSKGTTRTVVSRYDIYNSYPEYNTVNCGFQCSISLSGLTYSSHTLDVIAVTNSGNSYSLGAVTFYIQAQRPADWQWSRNGYSLYSGGGVYSTVTSGYNVTAYILTATEWNNFTSRINQFRTYRGMSTASFTVVSRDTNFTETILNQAINAINPMCGYPMYAAPEGSDVCAYYFTDMEYWLSTV